MATAKQMKRWHRRLRARAPLLGRLLQGHTLAVLQERLDDAEIVPLLLEALELPAEKLVRRARSALAALSSREAINALCTLWASKRTGEIGQIIAERGYVASKPRKLTILTSLKAGKTIETKGNDVAILAALLSDPDPAVSAGARHILENLPPGPCRDALCEEAIGEPLGEAARICIERGFRPEDHERACLFLFVTRQLDAYFEEDFEFQNLRLEYDRADARIRSHVMDVVRSGDRRCAGFFGGARKTLVSCTPAEISLAIESWGRHHEWARLFESFLQLPLRYGVPILNRYLRSSGWEPEDPELRRVYHEALAETDTIALPPAASSQDSNGSIFMRWLAHGQSKEFAQASEEELLDRLEKADPPEGVALVAALAMRGGDNSQAAAKVRSSPHWLVRFAGYASGLCRPGEALTPSSEESFWVRELAGAHAVVEQWPARATPADLEALEAAPPEAWAGWLGSMRRVLRALIRRRITVGTFTEMVVEAHEFAPEIEEAK